MKMKNKRIYEIYKKQEEDNIIHISECQQHLLKMFDRFCAFCKENGISVFLLWGTLLGAKRDGKIIPWDDDIDLGTSESDFRKILELKNSLSSYGLKLVHHSINKHIHSNGIRIYDDTLFEFCKSTFCDYIEPVYIDIFVFCRVSKSEKKLEIIKKIKRCYNLLIIKETKWKSRSFFRWFLRTIYRGILFIFSSRTLHKRIDSLVEQLYCGKGSYEIAFPDTFHNSKIVFFKKNAFDRLELIDFEKIACLAPTQYDYILTKSYGDWKKPRDRSSGEIFKKCYLIRKE